MRDELADKTIDNSFQNGRNHPMIQQRHKLIFLEHQIENGNPLLPRWD
ncbi:hypothetical protein [Komarekiella delphini-convector]|nr:hypothetical protein [Komarekiella delphini-convector]